MIAELFQGQLVLELGHLDLAGFCVRHASELGQASFGPNHTFGGSPTQQAVVQSFLKNYDKVSFGEQVQLYYTLMVILGLIVIKKRNLHNTSFVGQMLVILYHNHHTNISTI